MTTKQSGGSQSSGSSERGGSGNFANDPQRASEEGKKGGTQHSQHSGKQSQSGSEKSQRGASGNFANDPEKASEAGRKGGQHSHGGSTK